jgi:acetyl-CoA carboxylase biotin carboxyl carrier protein
MPLNEADIREILRLIDESDVEELRIETESLSLHVLRGDAKPHEEEPTAPAPAQPLDAPDGLVTIAAPMIGTFYRASAPGAAPFVDVGVRVEPETVVCIIEVMKMMNPVPAGVRGTIVEVCAENAEPVEFDTPLFRVAPAPEP